jgi:hypothetical protein
VLGNPPYVRQEQLAPVKGYLAAAYPETYHSVADLYVYFYQQGLRLLQAGGRLSYIVTNKWMRSGYGEPLRAFFTSQGELEQIIDFGHAPIFADADVFPCIVLVRKPARESPASLTDAHEVSVTLFPREALGTTSLDAYVTTHSYRVPRERFGATAWNLETADVNALMTRLHRIGIPLADFAGGRPLYGLKSGLTDAFVIDTITRERLVQAHPAAADLLRPYLRGQDMNRWLAESQGLWLIVLKSSGDHAWPWSQGGENAERLFQQTYPSVNAHLKPFEDRLRKRQDQGRCWWELRSCAYYDRFEQPKIFYPDITWRSQFSLDTAGHFSNNTVYFLPTADP